MVKIELQTVFVIILMIIVLIGGIYGTYIMYWDLKPNTNLDKICVVLSFLWQAAIGMYVIMGINELSKKSITINIDKIKQNLKQLIK